MIVGACSVEFAVTIQDEQTKMNKRKNYDVSVSFPHRNWREKAKNNGADSALVSVSEATSQVTRKAGTDREPVDKD